MCPIWLYFRSRIRLERLRRFAKGGNKDYPSMSLIWFLSRFMVKLERLSRFAKGDNRD